MIGVEISHGQIYIDFNAQMQRIEEWFIFNRSGQIGDIEYREGDRVLLSVTYKPTISQIRELINNSGWNEEVCLIERGYALILLSPINKNIN